MGTPEDSIDAEVQALIQRAADEKAERAEHAKAARLQKMERYRQRVRSGESKLPHDGCPQCVRSVLLLDPTQVCGKDNVRWWE